jgi:hypothetical protein
MDLGAPDHCGRSRLVLLFEVTAEFEASGVAASLGSADELTALGDLATQHQQSGFRATRKVAATCRKQDGRSRTVPFTWSGMRTRILAG